MKRRAFIKKAGFTGMIVFVDPLGSMPQPADALEKSFINPHSSASPYVYWFWMNGHISRQGITLDLEAMKEIGIGGVFNFDVGTGIPKGPVEYMSDEWLDLKKFALAEAARLDIAFTMHNCPGFSASGGPWINPAMAMQQITWSESFIAGGQNVPLNLPKPTSRLNYYKDIAVLAFPSLKEEELMQSVNISTNEGPQKNNIGGITVHPTATEPGWIQFAFNDDLEARVITFFIAGIGDIEKKQETGERTSVILQASNDGKEFRAITPINTGVESELQAGDKYIVYDIPVTHAKYYRISCTQPRRFRQVQFSGITRLKHWLEKTNTRPRNIMRVEEDSTIETTNDQEVTPNSLHDIDKIIDVTRFTDNGVLNWNAPAGNWTILRIGYTPTGATTQAAPDKGHGLECDKYNRDAMSFHFNHMMEKLLPLKGKVGLSIDSYEAGMQNWTPGFEKEFEKRCGYSITKYLPILTGGRIIDNIEITERFTWDLRRVQADMMAENYYGQFHALCKQHGLISYIEPYDSGPMEEMQVAAVPDISMGEFWYGISTTFPVENPVRRTLKLASSASHINNKQIVGAEAFTAEPDASRWLEYPFALKAIGDNAFTEGINRMIIHRFAHQPHPTAAPGMTMGPWGIHFDRTNTWWKPAKAWIKYLQRCQALLQQGHCVADLLYFSGEDANMYTRAWPDTIYPTPYLFQYDMADARALLRDMKVIDNRVVLKNGNSYALFVLQDYKAISLAILSRLKILVEEGMMVVGKKPERSTGLTAYDKQDEFTKIVHEIWGDIDGETVFENTLGKGKVFWGKTIRDISRQLSIVPDFQYTTDVQNTMVYYTHRKVHNADIYFISNQLRSYENIVGNFRIKNKTPEIWDPPTGKMAPAPLFENYEDGIRIPLHMEPSGSLMIVFRDKPTHPHLHTITKDSAALLRTVPFEQLVFRNQPANDFTITCWVKPESNILLEADFPADSKTRVSTNYFAIEPFTFSSDTNDRYAIVGFTAGRNGIVIWEGRPGQQRMALVIPAAIEGWNHIAVRYENNTPAVFLNGALLKQGVESKYRVRPSVPLLNGVRAFYEYNGDIVHVQLKLKSLSENDIAVLANTKPGLPSSPFKIDFAYGTKPALLIKENGNYQFDYSDGKKKSFTISDLKKDISIKSPWRVQFPAGSGAPTAIILPELISLHHHNGPGVKYFSGTATYSNNFNIPAGSITGKNWLLDLGQVEVIAEVIINGKFLGIVWKRPYQIDITQAIRQGNNQLQIKVTNLWTNRLIGDEQQPNPYRYNPGGGASGIPGITGGGIQQLPGWYIKGEPKPPNGRIAFTTWQHYTKDAPLAESGLIGPVILRHAVTKSL